MTKRAAERHLYKRLTEMESLVGSLENKDLGDSSVTKAAREDVQALTVAIQALRESIARDEKNVK